MEKRKNPIGTARTTISSVNKEMQKPRLTESVRNGGKKQTRGSSQNIGSVPKSVKIGLPPSA
jgi:hypothetical protein